MEYVPLGRTPFSVSQLCVGCWQAAGWSSCDDKKFIEVVEHAIASGLNFLDTAEAYGKGHSERLVGKAIAGKRDTLVIATKLPFNKSKPAELRRSLERSLKNLGTDYIDLYQQHWPPKEPALEVTLAELEKCKQEGKIRAIGVSNWMEPEWEECTNPSRVETLQPCYSLLWRSIEPVVLPLCRKHEIAVIPYSPLCQGILAGRFQSLDEVPNDPRKQNRLLTKELFPKVQIVLDTVSQIANEVGKTMSQVALRWLLDQPGVTAPIVGASSVTQVDENIGALGWALSAEHMDRLNTVSAPLSADLQPHDSLWNWHPREMG